MRVGLTVADRSSKWFYVSITTYLPLNFYALFFKAEGSKGDNVAWRLFGRSFSWLAGVAVLVMLITRWCSRVPCGACGLRCSFSF